MVLKMVTSLLGNTALKVLSPLQRVLVIVQILLQCQKVPPKHHKI